MNNLLPELPPAIDLETKQILKKTITANRKLAELKGIINTIPNATILINTLYIQEAKDSSAIENIITTYDEIYKQNLFTDLIKNPAVKEVENYAHALKTGFQLIKQQGFLSLNHICTIQQEIVQNKAGFRKQLIQLKNEQTGEIIYTPPQNPHIINQLLNNLEQYINVPNDELDPLIRMAIIHYQFESIHPFYDGNGRTGRIINILYLNLHQLLDLPALYLSRYITRNKANYYRLLQEVREKNNWEDWIYYMLDAVEQTSEQTITLILEIKTIMMDYKNRLRKALPKIYSQDLLNNLFKHPYTKIAFIEEDLNISRKTATKYLDILVEHGFLQKEKVWKTSYYINQPLLNLIVSAFRK
ncbi:MAG: Fic family protein [Thiomargarita sp.]|nr:Fic family protein [Thiomargarita sp.]